MKNLIDGLKAKIKDSYESSITIAEAEKLAAEFLHAQLLIADELKDLDLTTRMCKTTLKTLRATLYMQEATKSDKKPSDTYIENVINSNETMQSEQEHYDRYEADLEALQNTFNIFKEAHVFFRTVARGRFE